MVWVFGLIGGILGFIIGQAIVFHLLKDVPVEELKANKQLKIHYGLLNWAFALVGVLCGVLFLSPLFS